MQFVICNRNEYGKNSRDTMYLIYDNWDDYGLKTSFGMYYVDKNGYNHNIGPVKIGVVDMEESRIFDQLPRNFSSLPDNFFSLGQDDDYYSNIAQLGDTCRETILTALRDVAYNLNLFERFKSERVFGTSLLRSVSDFSIQHQFNRMAHGGARLTEYNFSYSFPTEFAADNIGKAEMDFSVSPDSNPPTNIHVMIGRNGTGKTSLIKNMIYSICSNDASRGSFYYTKQTHSRAEFANVLCVAFSPFDDFTELEIIDSSIPYTYIGLKKNSNDLLQSIEDQFIESFIGCISNARKRSLWLKAVQELTSDPTFDSINIKALVDNIPIHVGDATFSSVKENARSVFSQLSSGHKVVLLIVTCCVDKIEEKSIIFMDEPENHLHPPLLSALIRALSDLLIDRNGVAIISTHSPVVLQEVPSSCVWALRRYGNHVIAERLAVKTFGSSISQLTNEVFGLEVTNSGFHKLLAEAVDSDADQIWGVSEYDRIFSQFDGQLGDEARLHLRALLAVKAAQEE